MVLAGVGGEALKTVCVIQARLNSTRLPQKVLADICGKPMIQHVIERAQKIVGVDAVALTVPFGQAQPFREIIEQGPLIYLFEGPHPDMLSAYHQVAAALNADIVMRITGDCPLIDPELSEKVLEILKQNKHAYDYVANVGPDSDYPDGLDTEVFSWIALKRAIASAQREYDYHHVTPWIRVNGRTLYPMIACSELSAKAKGMKWSVDTAEDLDRVRKIMERVKGTSWLETLEARRKNERTF